MKKTLVLPFLLAPLASLPVQAAPFDVLWWDATPEFGGQAPDVLRQEMSNDLTSFAGGTVFSSTYVSNEAQGGLATHLTTNSYDVIIIDLTSTSLTFNMNDQTAIRDFYSSGNTNLGFDGNLYVRNINFVPESVFPGPGGAMGGFTVNSVFALADAGGGILFGTDHDCCQSSVNVLTEALLPGAVFSGFTTPTSDGEFFGDLLLNGPEPIAASDVLAHWAAIPSQAIAPTGTFTDFLGNDVTLSSLVDVASTVGGPRDSMFSTSLAVGGGSTTVDNPTVGGTGGGTPVIPLPLPAVLLMSAVLGLGALRKRG